MFQHPTNSTTLRLAIALCLGLSLSMCKDDKADPATAGSTPEGEVVPPGLPAPAEPPNDWNGDGIHSPHDAGLEEEEAPRSRVTVSATYCPRADCPVALDFSQAMVDAGTLEDAKVPRVRLEPKLKGEWAWESARRLVFTPKEGELLWGNSVTVSVPKLAPEAGDEQAMARAVNLYVRVPNLQVTPKVGAYWEVVRGQPRFVGVLNGGTGEIGRGPLLLVYDQRVNAKNVQGNLTATAADGSTVDMKVYRPSEMSQAYEGSLPNHYFVAISPKSGLEEDQGLSIEVPTWQDGSLGHQNVSVNYASSFSLVDSGFYRNRWDAPLEGPKPHNVQLKLEFDRGFSSALLRKHLTITPEPKSVDIRGGWGTAWLHLTLEPGTKYQAKTTREFTDLLGNPLKKQVNVRWRSKDLPPLLTAPTQPTLVERDRAKVSVRGRNLGALSGAVVAFASPEAFAKALGRGSATSCRDYGARGQSTELTPVEFPEAMNEMHEVSVPLPASGLACVELKAKGRGTERSGPVRTATLVQSADIGVTTKVSTERVFSWVTKLAQPAPIRGATVRLLSAKGSTVAQGTTDESGAVSLEAGELAAAGGVTQPLSVVVETESETVVTRLTDDRLSSAWQFGMRGAAGDPLYASVFTERGAYRPGETMHAKFIVGPASWLEKREVEAEIRDPRGQRVVRKNLALDDYGTADLDLPIKKGAPVGSYAVKLTAGGRTTTRNFKVEEYRVPTFQVKVKGGEWVRGDKAKARIQAKYLHGGKLAGRTARWELLREPHVFTPSAFPRYVFALGNATELAGTVAGGERFLDDEGAQLIGFVPDHPSSAGPMRYTLEASVTDVDRQAYSGRLSRVVHPADFYVGVRPPSRSVLSAGETLKVPVVATSPRGRAVEGVEVRVRLERVDHHTTARMNADREVQLLNRKVDVPQEDCVVETKGAAVICSFELADAGQYRVRAWAQDRERRNVQAGFNVFATGDTPAAWPRFDQDRVDVVADRGSYKPGDTAKLLVQSPYENAVGLLTIEREGVASHRLLQIKGDTPSIEIPITADHAPNIFASVVLVRGRVHDDKDASGFETGAPGFKIGYAHLKVEPVEQRLEVATSPLREVVTPGSKVDVEVSLEGPNGKPASGQVTLWAVDEAVLGLTGYRTPHPESELYAERALGVRTGESRLDLTHAKRSRLERLFPGGDGGEGEAQFSDIAVELRKLFKSTAYWNPNLEVGSSGKARVTIELPDNITTYRIMAVAVDTKGRVGSGDSKLLVKRPLIVQPVLPRFVYPGDSLELQVLAFNGTPEDGNVKFVSEFEGVRIDGGAKKSGTVKAKAGGQGTFGVPVTVTGSGSAKIRFAAQMGEHKDAVEITLPILPPGTKRTVVASKNVMGTETLTVNIPGERMSGTTKMEVVASTTSLTELKDAVGYLMRYPNGCIEQTTSTAYPLVVLKDLLPEIGVDVNMADLEKYTQAGLKRILSFQTEGGGLSYWPGGTEPHAFATSFGLTALIAAKKQGYDIPQKSLNRMADYLEATLKKGEIKESIPHGSIADGDSRALFVMTLGRLGRPQPAYISQLWKKRDKLTAFGLSFLGIAAAELPGDNSLVKPILAAVEKAAKKEAEEAWFEGERKGGYSFDSPLRTHASALLAYASGASSDSMSGKLLNGLLARRQGGMWGNTQENVFGIMGVHRLAGSGQGGTGPDMVLAINSKDYAGDDMEKLSRRVRRVRLADEELALKDGQRAEPKVTLTNNGGKPIMLTVRAEYDVPLTEDNRRATSNGFTLKRSYSTLEGESLEGKTIPLGDLVKVTLEVSTNKKLNYVAIDDKLPAGLEPLNTALETTERVNMGSLSGVAQKSLGLLSYQEIRDHRVAFFVDEMPAGEYEYSYVARATTPGTFLRPAGRAEAMYEPEVSGTTVIDNVTVK